MITPKKKSIDLTLKYILTSSVLVVVCILLQFIVISRFDAELPNLIFASIICISISAPKKLNIIISGIVGLILDIASHNLFFVNSVLFICISLLVSFLFSNYLIKNYINVALCIFLLYIIYDTVLFIIAIPNQIPHIFWIMCNLVLFRAIFTSIFSVLVNWILSYYK